MNQRDRYNLALQWVKEAGMVIKSKLKEEFIIHTKSNRCDLVTNIDKEIERFFISKIQESFPTHKIVGEEGQAEITNEASSVVWYVDPIDGTMNFINQKRNFCISLALYEEGQGIFGIVYDVVADDLYHCLKGHGAYLNETLLPTLKQTSLENALIALNGNWLIENKQLDYRGMWELGRACRGLRAYGSAALEFAYVANGCLDGYISPRLAPWDYAAGVILVEEVGGSVVTFKGEALSFEKVDSIVVSNGIQQELLQYIREV